MGLVLIIVAIVIAVVAVYITKRKMKANSDIDHCNLNPSYNIVHSAITNQHNIVYDEVHTTPSCTDNPAYGTRAPDVL